MVASFFPRSPFPPLPRPGKGTWLFFFFLPPWSRSRRPARFGVLLTPFNFSCRREQLIHGGGAFFFFLVEAHFSFPLPSSPLQAPRTRSCLLPFFLAPLSLLDTAKLTRSSKLTHGPHHPFSPFFPSDSFLVCVPPVRSSRHPERGYEPNYVSIFSLFSPLFLPFFFFFRDRRRLNLKSC